MNLSPSAIEKNDNCLQGLDYYHPEKCMLTDEDLTTESVLRAHSGDVFSGLPLIRGQPQVKTAIRVRHNSHCGNVSVGNVFV